MDPLIWPASCFAPRAMRSSFLLLSFAALAGLAACESSSADDVSASPSEGAPADSTPAKPEGESKESEEKPKDPSTSIVVGIDSEPLANQGYNLSALVAKVKVDGLLAAEKTYLAKDGPLFPRELEVDAPAAKVDAKVEVEVTGIMGEAEVVKRWVRTAFDPGHSKLVHVFLQTTYTGRTSSGW